MCTALQELAINYLFLYITFFKPNYRGHKVTKRTINNRILQSKM